jgi:hypothetical protein
VAFELKDIVRVVVRKIRGWGTYDVHLVHNATARRLNIFVNREPRRIHRQVFIYVRRKPDIGSDWVLDSTRRENSEGPQEKGERRRDDHGEDDTSAPAVRDHGF